MRSDHVSKLEEHITKLIDAVEKVKGHNLPESEFVGSLLNAYQQEYMRVTGHYYRQDKRKIPVD